MNRRRFLKSGAPLVAAPFLSSGWADAQTPSPLPLPPAGADGWVSLTNFRNLDGLYTMLQRSGKGVAEQQGMVTFENGMLHLMGNQVTDKPAETGYLCTNNEYENYRVRVEYMWGMKRFLPRLESKRDNGLLYHVVGEDKVWPTCVECQIQEGDVGDYFLLGNARGAQGTGFTDAKNNRVLRDRGGDFEIKGGWNTVEVICQGDRSTQIVNGVTLNSISELQQPDLKNPGQFIKLARGKIAIELEYAEIWYRRFEIKSLA